MDYPTLQQVEAADREQLGKWYRFLQSPGWAYLNSPEFEFHKKLEEEVEIMDLICLRFKEMGMFTPELSKELGW